MHPGTIDTIFQRIQVTYDYPVHFTDHVFDTKNVIVRDLCQASGGRTEAKVLCVVDRGLSSAFPELVPQISRYFEENAAQAKLVEAPLLVEGGEIIKNDHHSVNLVQQAIEGHGIDRHSYIIAIGGGALLDMVGYAAATAHRGVRLIRIPTTVLSQDDSGVGVKNSVNAFGKKNFLGTFAPPFAVINDMALLTKLPDRDWLSGISEAVKVSLLKDASFFEFLEHHASALVARDVEIMRWVVFRSAELHLTHIATSGDPFEFGSSRPLDFGHWSAHKLEQISNYRWRHGEAVSIGIALDCTYAFLGGMLTEAAWRRIINLFLALQLPIYADELLMPQQSGSDHLAVIAGLNEFREHLGGQLTIMLLHGIGDGFEVHEMDEDRIVQSIELLRDLQVAGIRHIKEDSDVSQRQQQLSTFATAID